MLYNSIVMSVQNSPIHCTRGDSSDYQAGGREGERALIANRNEVYLLG